MPAVTIDDVLTAVRTKWTTGAMAGVALYGFRKAPGVNLGTDGTSVPAYAVATAGEDLNARERFTDGKLLQRFDLTVDVWTVAPGQTGNYERQTEAALSGTPANPSAGLSLAGSNRVVRSWGKGWVMITDPKVTGGQDVFKLTGKWTLLVQSAE